MTETELGRSSDVDTTMSLSRSVKFAQPIIQDSRAEELLQLSSSDSEDERTQYSLAFPEREDDTEARKSIKSTYLERNDFKALLESLRRMEQRDTAKHLMTTFLVKYEMHNRTYKNLRASWTAWPVLSMQHTCPRVCEGRLKSELKANLHKRIYQQLRESGRTESADDLPEELGSRVVEALFDKLHTFLEKIRSIRFHQGGLANSSVRRLGLLGHDDLLAILWQVSEVSPGVGQRITDRSQLLFGSAIDQGSTEFCTKYDTILASPVIEEIAAGSGRFEARGLKRRRIISDDSPSRGETHHALDGSPAMHAGESGPSEILPTIISSRITRDAGKKFDKFTRLVPARISELERIESDPFT